MLVVVSAAHGRHDLFDLWCEHTAPMFDAVVCAVTVGEIPLLASCERHGITGVPWRNEPLGEKFNAALYEAMKMGATRIVILPSDDFVSQEWVDIARHSIADYIIPPSCGVYSPEANRAIVIRKNYPAGMLTFGAGRIVSKRAIDATGDLWPPNLNRGLDSASNTRLREAGFRPVQLPTKAIPITDVKTRENIWPMSTWEPMSIPSTPNEVLHMVSDSMRERLSHIR